MPFPKKHLTEKLTLDKQAKDSSGRNWLGVLFGALLYMAQGPGH